MKKFEKAILIKIVYDYNGNEWMQYLCLSDYLTRCGYFFKRSSKYASQPTRKLFKLLQQMNIEVEALKEYQKEFKETNHIVVYDKLGNKKVI